MGKKILLIQSFFFCCFVGISYSQPTMNGDVSAGNNKNRPCVGAPSSWDQCIGTLDSGNIYTGEFRKGKMEGKGKLRIIVKGRSTRDAIASEIPSTYIGEFKDNRIQGYGAWTTDQGQKFEGYFVENIYQGKNLPPQQNASQGRAIQQNSAANVISKATISAYGKGSSYYLYSSPCETPKLKQDYPYKAEEFDLEKNMLKGVGCYAANKTDEYVYYRATDESGRATGGASIKFSQFDRTPQLTTDSRYVQQAPQQVQQAPQQVQQAPQAPQRPQRSAQQQQMCDNLAQKISENDPSQNGWLAFMNGLQAANAQAGNYGNGGVAMANQNKIQQEQLVMQLNDQYMRYCQ